MKKLLLVLLILLFCGCSKSYDAKKWLNYAPNDESFIDVPDSDYFEVSASELSYALYLLKDKAEISIDKNTGKKLVGNYFECSGLKSPYLVRALYGNAGAGKFTIEKNKSDFDLSPVDSTKRDVGFPGKLPDGRSRDEAQTIHRRADHWRAEGVRRRCQHA